MHAPRWKGFGSRRFFPFVFFSLLGYNGNGSFFFHVRKHLHIPICIRRCRVSEMCSSSMIMMMMIVCLLDVLFRVGLAIFRKLLFFETRQKIALGCSESGDRSSLNRFLLIFFLVTLGLFLRSSFATFTVGDRNMCYLRRRLLYLPTYMYEFTFLLSPPLHHNADQWDISDSKCG